MLDIFWLLVSELKLKHVISWHHQTAENTTHHSHGSNHINYGCSRHRKSSHTRLLLFLLAVCGNRTGDGTYRGLYVTNSVLWSCTWALVLPQKNQLHHLSIWKCFSYISDWSLSNPCLFPIWDLQGKALKMQAIKDLYCLFFFLSCTFMQMSNWHTWISTCHMKSISKSKMTNWV